MALARRELAGKADFVVANPPFSAQWNAGPTKSTDDRFSAPGKLAPKTKAAILIGPLKAGRYEFVGEFHEATAKGVVIAE